MIQAVDNPIPEDPKSYTATNEGQSLPQMLGKMNQMILRPAKKFLNNYFFLKNNG